MEMQELCLEGMHCSMPSTVIYKPCHLFTSPVTCLQALTFVYKPWHLFTSPDVCLQALTFVYKPWHLFTSPVICLQALSLVYKPWHLFTSPDICLQALTSVYKPWRLFTSPDRCQALLFTSPDIVKYLGLARTIYIRFIYGIFGREITKYTVIYGVNIRSWPTLQIFKYCLEVTTSCWTQTAGWPQTSPYSTKRRQAIELTGSVGIWCKSWLSIWCVNTPTLHKHRQATEHGAA